MHANPKEPVTLAQIAIVFGMSVAIGAVGWFGANFASMYRDSGATNMRDREIDKLDARIQSLETALRNCH